MRTLHLSSGTDPDMIAQCHLLIHMCTMKCNICSLTLVRGHITPQWALRPLDEGVVCSEVTFEIAYVDPKCIGGHKVGSNLTVLSEKLTMSGAKDITQFQ